LIWVAILNYTIAPLPKFQFFARYPLCNIAMTIFYFIINICTYRAPFPLSQIACQILVPLEYVLYSLLRISSLAYYGIRYQVIHEADISNPFNFMKVVYVGLFGLTIVYIVSATTKLGYEEDGECYYHGNPINLYLFPTECALNLLIAFFLYYLFVDKVEHVCGQSEQSVTNRLKSDSFRQRIREKKRYILNHLKFAFKISFYASLIIYPFYFYASDFFKNSNAVIASDFVNKHTS